MTTKFIILCIFALSAMSFGNGLKVEDLKSFVKEKQGILEIIGETGTKAYFKDTSNNYFTFGAYVDYCKRNDMNTASIETAAETAVIEGYLNATGYSGWLWIGAWSPSVDGNWSWMNNGEPLTYTNWYPGRPIDGGDRNCAFLYYSGDPHGQWRDTTCGTDSNVPLCQVDLTH